MDYRCPSDGVLLFRASGPLLRRVQIKCRSCGDVVEPEASAEVMHRTYRCVECEQTFHVERPDESGRSRFCAACGTRTLVVSQERTARTRDVAAAPVRR